MAEAATLSDAIIEQCVRCNWLFSADGAFVRLAGDLFPVFGKPAADLAGRDLSEALDADQAGLWRDRIRRVLSGETLLLRERRSAADWALLVCRVEFQGTVYVGGSGVEITLWNSTEQELRHTVLGALKAQEFERNMLSKFLHDKVGQNLTALGLQLDLIRMDLDQAFPDAAERVKEMQKLLEGMMEEVREYCYVLNPSAVDRAGLRAALDRLSERLRARYQGTFRVIVDPSLRLNPKIASALFQIAQDAAENAVQHSGCSTVEIEIKSTKAGLSLEVRDNGHGFDPADIIAGRRGLGLLSMEHHAAQAGLELQIRSSRGRGTTVRAAGPEN